jgi:hypothetical protein
VVIQIAKNTSEEALAGQSAQPLASWISQIYRVRRHILAEIPFDSLIPHRIPTGKPPQPGVIDTMPIVVQFSLRVDHAGLRAVDVDAATTNPVLPGGRGVKSG